MSTRRFTLSCLSQGQRMYARNVQSEVWPTTTGRTMDMHAPWILAHACDRELSNTAPVSGDIHTYMRAYVCDWLGAQGRHNHPSPPVSQPMHIPAFNVDVSACAGWLLNTAGASGDMCVYVCVCREVTTTRCRPPANPCRSLRSVITSDVLRRTASPHRAGCSLAAR